MESKAARRAIQRPKYKWYQWIFTALWQPILVTVCLFLALKVISGYVHPSDATKPKSDGQQASVQYWRGLHAIEERSKLITLPNEALAKDMKYDQFQAQCARASETFSTLSQEIRSLPVTGVDDEIVNYSSSLASFYAHEAILLQEYVYFSTELKELNSHLYGISALIESFLQPQKAINILWGNGTDPVKAHAKALTDKTLDTNNEEQRIAALRMSTRTLLTKRYRTEFP